jgi:hypothetical protein
MIVLEDNNAATIQIACWWIGNDKDRLDYWLQEAAQALEAPLDEYEESWMILADNLKDFFEDWLEDEVIEPLNGEFLTLHLAMNALTTVNWDEIAKGLIDKHLENVAFRKAQT